MFASSIIVAVVVIGGMSLYFLHLLPQKSLLRCHISNYSTFLIVIIVADIVIVFAVVVFIDVVGTVVVFLS